MTATTARQHGLFIGVLLLYFTLGTAYAVQTPRWQAPDEPAHYRYIEQLAAGTLPLMESGDYDQAGQSAAITAEFDPALPLTGFSYEDYQPPLYYLLLTPVFRLTGGSVIALRLTSMLLGAGVVLSTYAIGRRLHLPDPLVLGASAVVALLPQHLAILGSINNDALAWLLIAVMLWLLLRHRSADTLPPPTAQWSLGVLLGLAFLTKVTAYLMAPVVGLVFLAVAWRDRPGWRPFLWAALRLALPALLLGTLWWGRNLLVYPGPDFLGTMRHDAVVIGQPTTTAWIAQFGFGAWLNRFVTTTFHSFWGQFGWMAAPLPRWAYLPLWLLVAAGMSGLLLDRPAGTRPLAILFAFAVLLYVVYNARFVQHQGRYLFAALIPIAYGLSAGLTAWRARLNLPAAADYLWLAALAGYLVALNLYALRFILPCLSYANPVC